jgi:hypothetical protein
MVGQFLRAQVGQFSRAVLFEIDRGLAEEARLKGCGACGAVVHVADYPRKVRGGPWRLDDETHDRRLSFCCSRPGCRKRLTPPSVRFVARHVYLSVVVVLAGLLTQGPSRLRVRFLSQLFGVSRRTVARWRSFWQTRFEKTRTFRDLRGRLLVLSPDEPHPATLFDRLEGSDHQRLFALLELLSPMSASAALFEGVRISA